MEIKNEDSDCEVDVQSNSKVLPGFRFHPTEEELVGFYLRRKVERKPFKFDLIEVVELCNYDPWDLPGLADRTRDREWFFFVPRDARHQGHGGRPNRMTVSGYWKATGTDRRIYGQRSSDVIGLKKTLVFYIGKAPKGQKTDWIMNEYRLARSDQLPTVSEGISTNEFTLCRIYKKAGISITSFDRRPRIEVEHRELMASSSCKPRHFQISMASKDTVSGIDSASPNKLQLGASATPTAEHRLNSANGKPTSELLTQIQGTSTRCLSDPIDENTFPSLEEKNNEAISSAMTEDPKGQREINGRLLPCLTHVNSFDRWCSELISWMPSPNGSSPLWNPPV